MATHFMMRVSMQFHDSDPKNQAVITPHFRRQTDILDPVAAAADYTSLQTDLKNALAGWVAQTGELTISTYRVDQPKPRYPQTDPLVAFPGTAAAVNLPPELAVCLSFFGPRNVKSHRGRMYIPAWMCGATGTQLSTPVVNTTTRDKVALLVPIFAGLGGTNIDWIVWSPTLQAATKVENWFVKDEWAIQRRRGIKETARKTGTTSG